jgi:DNA polymerase-3 subunit epsilon
MLPNKKLAIVDVETNGYSAAWGRVIEVGVLRVERGVVVETYRSLVNPGHRIPRFITGLTGIKQEELDAAPFFEDIAVTLERLLSGAVFVAHNVGFDYAFIRNEFQRLGMEFRAPRLCTVEISRALYPQARKHDLSSVITRHGIPCPARHRAFDDAKVLWDFLSMAASEQPERFEAVIDERLRRRQLRNPRRVLYIPQRDVDDEAVIS